MSDLYRPFLELVPKGGRILDAGCGAGRDLKAFWELGYEVTGFDASALLASFATSYTGIQCHHMTFDEVDWRTEFDGIWACASLLHIPKSELLRVLGLLSVALKNNGVLYASFQEGSGKLTLDDGRVFYNFSESELLELCNGLDDAKVLKIWKTQDVSNSNRRIVWINILLQKN
ncbi:MAG: class I SAM-dependent methyltransferase [Pseudomonadales bacterium]